MVSALRCNVTSICPVPHPYTSDRIPISLPDRTCVCHLVFITQPLPLSIPTGIIVTMSHSHSHSHQQDLPCAHPPIFTNLNELYDEQHVGEQEKRLSTLRSRFVDLYGAPPSFIVRAPGRVNLIGEHIDYCGYGVLPMALATQDTLIACRINEPTVSVTGGERSGPGSDELIHLANMDEQRYPAFIFSTQHLSNAQSHATSLSATASNSGMPTSPPSILDIDSSPAASSSCYAWVRYVQAGIRGVVEAERRNMQQRNSAPGTSHDVNISSRQPIGLPAMQLLVDGSVPPAAGLSSSSSLVCAAALTACMAMRCKEHGNMNGNGNPSLTTLSSCIETYTKRELAAVCASSERWVGTAGGGMDQAISFLAQPSSAMRIDFRPSLTATPVTLPHDATFLVAHCGVRSEKAVAAKVQFNKRVLEVTLAAHLLAKVLRLGPYGTSCNGKECDSNTSPLAKLTLADVQEQSGLSLEEMVKYIQSGVRPAASNEDRVLTTSNIAQPLHPRPYTLSELHVLLGRSSLKPLIAFRPSLNDALDEGDHHDTGTMPSFALYQRALHVYSEALRVRQFADMCTDTARMKHDEPLPSSYASASSNPSSSTTTAASSLDSSISALGTLMNESHCSCSQSYECSCPELDKLVEVVRNAGAAGARLTGAGWGGCIVALIDSSKLDNDTPSASSSCSSRSPLDNFLNRIVNEYYVAHCNMTDRPPTYEHFRDLMFITQPGAGVAVYSPVQESEASQ